MGSGSSVGARRLVCLWQGLCTTVLAHGAELLALPAGAAASAAEQRSGLRLRSRRKQPANTLIAGRELELIQPRVR